MLVVSRVVLLFHVILLLRLELISAQNGNDCSTPIGESGKCVVYTECQYIYDMMHENDISNSNVNYIRNSQCGYEENKPWVCCSLTHLAQSIPRTTYNTPASTTPPTTLKTLSPNTQRDRSITRADERCKTQFEEDYDCIALQDCPTLFNISKQLPKISQNQRLLQRSQCGFSRGKILVCCPNPNLDSQTVDHLPDPTDCGIASTPRIFGGTTVEQGEFPWLALIVYTAYNANKQFLCGGSLINSRYVLTAAHCLRRTDDFRATHVRLGEWDLDVNPDCLSKNECWEYTDVEIEEIILHPQYRTNSQNDIALLRLSKTVDKHYVKPICLPKTSNLYNNIFTNRNVTVAGWGRTEYSSISRKPLKANLNIMEQENCKNAYNQSGRDIYQTQICANGDGDTCSGDSGGPLMIIEKIDNVDVFILAGLTSFGTSYCTTEHFPGIYTSVGAYMDWIRNQIRP